MLSLCVCVVMNKNKKTKQTNKNAWKRMPIPLCRQTTWAANSRRSDDLLLTAEVEGKSGVENQPVCDWSNVQCTSQQEETIQLQAEEFAPAMRKSQSRESTTMFSRRRRPPYTPFLRW